MLKKNLTSMFAAGIILAGAGLASAAPVATKDSTAFNSGGLDQIEGDVDPVTQSPYTEQSLGATTYDVTVNGDGTYTAVTAYDAGASPALFPAIGYNDADGDFLSATTGFTWETRMRIDSANDPDRGVWEIYMRDSNGDSGNGQYAATRIHFLSTGIDRDTAGNGNVAEVQMDLTDGFHVIRAAVNSSNQTSVWIDGVLVLDELVSLTFDNGQDFMRIGRWGGATRGGTTTIDYIRFDTTGAFAPVPEPASLALLGLGSLMMIKRKRRA